MKNTATQRFRTIVLLLVLLAIGSAIYFGFTKGPEVKSVQMNIDNNN